MLKIVVANNTNASSNCRRAMSIMARAKMRAGLPETPEARPRFRPTPSLVAQPSDAPTSRTTVVAPPPPTLSGLLPTPVAPPSLLHSLPSVETVHAQPIGAKCLQAALLGPANAGKSSLVNAVTGHNSCIVSPLAQTTRERVTSVWNDGPTQIVFLDTPGVVDAQHRAKVSRSVITAPWSAVPNAQHILVVLDAAKLLYKSGPSPIESYLFRRLDELSLPVTVIFNKVDMLLCDSGADAAELGDSSLPADFLASRAEILASPRAIRSADETSRGSGKEHSLGHACRYLAKTFRATKQHDDPRTSHYFVSAKTGLGLAPLKQRLQDLASVGPHLFPPTTKTDTAPDAMLTQLVRQGFYARLHGSVPYTLRQKTVLWESNPTELHIVHKILVDRPGIERIVVGRGGSVVRAVQDEAAAALGAAMGVPVKLFLDVTTTK
ncbi:P-loop containing nucleoside triphosphate hydrolase protein [Blastocladiella britannica]|nr:P-loop containing nucleoside triphosphate hydrolase protein [Blastocladiella britannica]